MQTRINAIILGMLFLSLMFFPMGSAMVIENGFEADSNSLQVSAEDTTPPITNDDNLGWHNSSFTITLTPNDDMSGVMDTLYCFDYTDNCTPNISGTSFFVDSSITTEGISYFRYYSIDNAGNSEALYSSQVKLDLTAPYLLYNESTEFPDSITFNSTGPGGAVVTYIVTAQDAIGGGLDATCTPNSGYTFPIGTTQVTCTVQDYAGNSATELFNVVVSGDSPTGNEFPVVSIISPNNNEVVSGYLTVNASATDDHGVVAVQFLLDGSPLSVEDTDAPYSVLFDTNLISDGAHTVSAAAWDEELQTTFSEVVNIIVNNNVNTSEDTTAPVTHSDILPGWHNESFLVVWHLHDENDIAATYYCIDQDDTCTPNLIGESVYIDSNVTANITVIDGINYIRFYSVDIYGNTEAVQSSEIRLDRVAPYVSIDDITPLVVITNNSFANVTFNVSAGDSVGGGLDATCTPNSGSLFSVGTTQVTCTVQDYASNTNSITFDVIVESESVNADNTPPVLTVYSPVVNSTISSPFLVNFSAIDSSGIESMWFIDGSNISSNISYTSPILHSTIEGNHTWSFFARDFAGNEAFSSVSFTVFSNVGNETPTNETPVNETYYPVSLDIISPVQTIYNSTNILVNLSSSNSTNIIYWIDNGEERTYNGSVVKTLSEGNHTIIVHAYNPDYFIAQNVSFSIILDEDSDSIPPSRITNLRANETTNSSITWTWKNPSNDDFDVALIYIDGEFVTATSQQSILVENLSSGTEYEISITTRDLAGNINDDEVSDSQFTLTYNNKIVPDCTITLLNEGTINYPEKVRIESSCTNPETAPLLTLDGVVISGLDDNRLLAVGEYTYRVSTDETETYGSASSTLNVEVEKGTPILSLNGTNGIFFYPSIVQVEGVGCPAQLDETCTLSINGDNEVVAGVLTVGTYNYEYETSGNQNYTSASVNATINVLNASSTQQFAYDNNISILNTTSDIIFAPGYNTTLLNIPSTSNATVNFALLYNGSSVVTEQNLTLIKQIGSNQYYFYVPANITISGAGWDGRLALPSIANAESFSSPSGNINLIITLGTSGEILFSEPVKIVLPGMAGKQAAWTNNVNGTLTPINSVCNSATNPVLASGVRECYISSGSDLIIWTTHLTTFAAYTPSEESNGGGSGGSSGSRSGSGRSGGSVSNIPSAASATPSSTSNSDNTDKNTPVDLSSEEASSDSAPSGFSTITGAVTGAFRESSLARALGLLFFAVAVILIGFALLGKDEEIEE